MTIYEQMTKTIESYTESCYDFERMSGNQSLSVRGMIDGVENARANLTIEAAECVVF